MYSIHSLVQDNNSEDLEKIHLQSFQVNRELMCSDLDVQFWRLNLRTARATFISQYASIILVSKSDETSIIDVVRCGPSSRGIQLVVHAPEFEDGLFTIPTLYQLWICERISLYCFGSSHSLVGTRSGYRKCTPIGYTWPESMYVYGPYWTCGCGLLTPSSASTFSAFAALISSSSASLASTAPSTPCRTCYSIDVPSICLIAPCAEAQAWIVSSLMLRLSDSPG